MDKSVDNSVDKMLPMIYNAKKLCKITIFM